MLYFRLDNGQYYQMQIDLNTTIVYWRQKQVIPTFYVAGFHSISGEVDLKLYFPHVRWILSKLSKYEMYELEDIHTYKPANVVL